MGRRPEDFDGLGESAICRLGGEYSTATLYFSAGSLGLDVQTSAEFGENIPLTEEAAAEWRDNLDAWLRWRNPDKYNTAPPTLDPSRCPTHGRSWKSVERRPGGKRLCPAGDAWRSVRGTLIPWGEEV